MIKNALHIYRKNIWNVFAIIGFVSLGIFIGLFVVLPVIANSLNVTVNSVISKATSELQTFNANGFIKVFNEQFTKLDWANPIKTVKYLFENNGLLKIIEIALGPTGGGLDSTQIKSVINNINYDVRNFISLTITELYVLIAIIGVTSIVGFIATKIVIQINSTNDRNIVRFICSFVLNLASLALFYVLLLISILSIPSGVGLFFAVLAVFILMLICMLIVSVLCYKKKGIKILDILNIKNTIYLFLSSLIVLGISVVILVIVYIFSDIIALLISIPLLLITTIIIENIVVADVTTNLYKNLNTSK